MRLQDAEREWKQDILVYQITETAKVGPIRDSITFMALFLGCRSRDLRFLQRRDRTLDLARFIFSGGANDPHIKNFFVSQKKNGNRYTRSKLLAFLSGLNHLQSHVPFLFLFKCLIGFYTFVVKISLSIKKSFQITQFIKLKVKLSLDIILVYIF